LRVVASGDFALANVPGVERAIADELGSNIREVTVGLAGVRSWCRRYTRI
jgi:hypothetical protein